MTADHLLRIQARVHEVHHALIREVHKALLTALSSPKDSELKILCEKTWDSMEKGLCSPDQTSIAFDDLEKPEKENDKDLFIVLVWYYKAACEQYYVLHQLATLGTDLDALEKRNDERGFNATEREIAVNNTGPEALANLRRGMDRIRQQARGQHVQAVNYQQRLNGQFQALEKELKRNEDNFNHSFDEIQKACSSLALRINKYQAHLAKVKDAARQTIQDLQEQIQNLADHFAAMKKENILDLSHDLENKDHYPVRLAALEKALREHQKYLQENEYQLNDEARGINQEYPALEKKLRLMKDTKAGFIADIDGYRKDVTNTAPEKCLAGPPVLSNRDDFPLIREVDALYTKVNGCAASLKSAETGYMEAQADIRAFCESLGTMLLIRLNMLLGQYRNESTLSKINDEFSRASDAFAKEARNRCQRFLGLAVGAEAQRWEAVAAAVKKSFDTTSSNMTALQTAITGGGRKPKPLEEIKAQAKSEIQELKNYVNAHSAEYAFLQKALTKRREPFDDLSKAYNELINNWVESVRHQLEEIYADAVKQLDLIKLNMQFRLDAFKSQIASYHPDISALPEQDVTFLGQKECLGLEKKIVELNETYRKKIQLLRQRELDDAVANTTQLNSGHSQKAPGFISRHWGKILSATLGGMALGAGAGFVAGSFALPVFGLGTLALSGIGCVLGAGVGLMTGIVSAVIADCCAAPARRNQEERVQSTTRFIREQLPECKPAPSIRPPVTQQYAHRSPNNTSTVNPSIRPAVTHQYAPGPVTPQQVHIVTHKFTKTLH